MSENYGLKVSCGRHGIVGCERCFGSYRLVRPMVRRTELDELRAERDSLAASLEAKDAELSELRARVEEAVAWFCGLFPPADETANEYLDDLLAILSPPEGP